MWPSLTDNFCRLVLVVRVVWHRDEQAWVVVDSISTGPCMTLHSSAAVGWFDKCDKCEEWLPGIFEIRSVE